MTPENIFLFREVAKQPIRENTIKYERASTNKLDDEYISAGNTM